MAGSTTNSSGARKKDIRDFTWNLFLLIPVSPVSQSTSSPTDLTFPHVFCPFSTRSLKMEYTEQTARLTTTFRCKRVRDRLRYSPRWSDRTPLLSCARCRVVVDIPHILRGLEARTRTQIDHLVLSSRLQFPSPYRDCSPSKVDLDTRLRPPGLVVTGTAPL
jgi:hypothetical protein